MPHPNLVLQVAFIVLGPLQFGLHMSELNAPLPYMPCSADNITDCIPGLDDGASASSAYAIGGLLGSLMGGPSADRYGRKSALQAVSIVFFIGSVIAAMAGSNDNLVVGRFISGIAAGAAIVVGPMFISEISPDEYKGMLGACSQISVNCGILLTQFFGVLWAKYAWRRILWVGPISALVQSVALSFAVESPNWLLSRGRSHDARVNSTWLGKDFSQVRDEQHEQRQEQRTEASIYDYLTAPRYRHSLFLAAGIMCLQQFSGINAIIFYGVSILRKVIPLAELINLGLSFLNLAFTVVSARLIDTLGRRKLLVSSLVGMAVGTSMLAFGLIANTPFLSAMAAVIVIVSFAMGLGPIPFLLIGEHTPADALGVAQSVGTTFNWLATFTIGAFFPLIQQLIGPGVWYLFSMICIVGAVLIAKFLK